MPCLFHAGAEGFSSAGSRSPPELLLSAGRKPVPSPSAAPVFPPPASRTFRGYSRLCREITSIPIHFSAKKNAQAHNMTVLRISSYHAAKIPCFSEKQPHKMSFYRYFVIICEENERAGQGGEKKIFPAGTARALGGLACPSRISFSTSGAFRKHVSSPWPGKQPFFRPNASRSTAWPGK